MLVVMFTARQVRIGDLAAGTVLVYEQAAAPETLASAGSHGNLSLQQAETIRELLDRWRDLDRSVRIGLALRLMESLGEHPALGAKERTNDKLLQARLTELLARPKQSVQ
jgi:succinylglutamate desuccinylase